jgi:hypothetical protein
MKENNCLLKLKICDNLDEKDLKTRNINIKENKSK